MKRNWSPGKPRPLLERFMEKVEKTDTCWIWRGCFRKQRPGKKTPPYGQFKVNFRNENAHRVAYEQFVGPIPAGMCVLHECDNPVCVNPRHLRIGTVMDNNSDRDRKGRFRALVGEKNGMTKLTAEDVREIRASISEHQHIVAKRFGVSQATVNRILLRKVWKHVP